MAARRASLGTVALLLLVALLAALAPPLCAAMRGLPDTREHALPGWRGELKRRRAAEDESAAPKIRFLSWSPRIILVERFMNESECAHIIKLARSQMERSTVVDNESGGSVLHDIRTSTGTFLRPLQDAIVAAVQQRIAELSLIPIENQEAMQVLHYGLNEQYGAHMDTFDDAAHTLGKQRIATALSFLSEPESGGETSFPNVPSDATLGPEWSQCARGTLAHKPKTGDLILFFSLTPEGEVDMGATHAACPVTRGEKWSAPLWMHQAPFGALPRGVALASPDGDVARDGGDACVDLDAGCRAWAKAGECARNAGFMLGVPGQFVGRCRVACSACPHPRLVD